MGRNNRTHRNRGVREELRDPGYELRSEAEVMGRKRGLFLTGLRRTAIQGRFINLGIMLSNQGGQKNDEYDNNDQNAIVRG